MATENYPGTSPSNLGSLLHKLAPPKTANSVLQALHKSGIAHGGTVGVLHPTGVSFPPAISVNASQDQVVILGPNAVTQVDSTGGVIIATTGGSNYVDISHSPKSLDQPDTVIGSSGSDYIQGNSKASLLKGGSGNEQIHSGGGKDTIYGGSGHNTLVGGGQSLVLGGIGYAKIFAGEGTNSHDTIFAGTGYDTISLTAGNNVVHGPTFFGVASITAGSGMDTIYGGAGRETVNGGAQTSLYLGKGSTALNIGAQSNDTIYGGSNVGSLTLNKASSDATISAVQGTDQTKITFASGGSITTVGSVAVTFTDHTTKTV